MHVGCPHQVLDRIAGDLRMLPVDADEIEPGLRRHFDRDGCGIAANVPISFALAMHFLRKSLMPLPLARDRDAYPQTRRAKRELFQA